MERAKIRRAMKELSLRAMLLAAYISSVAALPAQVSIGQRIGVSSSTIKYKATHDQELLAAYEKDLARSTGVSIGVPLEVRLGDLFAMQMEPGFSMKGYGHRNGNGSSELRLNYAELALLGKAILERGNIGGEVFCGPAVAYGVSIRSIYDTPSPEATSTDELTSFNKSIFAPFQMDVMAGAGVRYRVGVPLLFIQYRYSLGLTGLFTGNIFFTDVNGNVLTDANARSRSSIVSIGITVPLSAAAWRENVVPE